MIRFKSKYPIVFLLLWAFARVRMSSRFDVPELWAEDGPVFLCEALVQGWKSIFNPFAGNFHVVQRLVVVATTRLFSVAAYPSVFIAAYSILIAAIGASLSRRTYAWISEPLAPRVLAGMLFILAPGLWEMMGNLCNVGWVLFFWPALLALKDPRDRYRGWEIVTAGFCLWSSGSVLLLAPLFAWRYFHAARRDLREALLPTGLVTAVVGLFAVRESIPVDLAPIWRYGFVTLLDHAQRSFLFQPWLGDWVTIDFAKFPVPYFAVGVSGLLVLGWYLWRRRREKSVQALTLFAVSLLAWPVLSWIGRPGVIEVFRHPVEQGFWRFRYAFPIGAMAAIFWCLLLGPLSLRAGKWRFSAAFLFFVLGFGSNLYRLRLHPYGPDRYWENSWPVLESTLRTGVPPEVVVPLHPKGWSFRYRAGDANQSCVTPQTRR